jgi:hypothetical protein
MAWVEGHATCSTASACIGLQIIGTCGGDLCPPEERARAFGAGAVVSALLLVSVVLILLLRVAPMG